MGTTKTPTTWIPQPVGYGYITTIAQSFIVDQLANFIVDQHGNFIVTGTQSVQVNKIPTAWSNTAT